MYGSERQELKRKMHAKPYNKDGSTEELGIGKTTDQKKGHRPMCLWGRVFRD